MPRFPGLTLPTSWEEDESAVYAKGGFVPRRKGQRYRHLYDRFGLQFFNQQGKSTDGEDLGKVELLGTFLAPDHYPGVVARYRAFKVTTNSGEIFAFYSYDADQYVMCPHTEYLAP